MLLEVSSVSFQGHRSGMHKPDIDSRVWLVRGSQISIPHAFMEAFGQNPKP